MDTVFERIEKMREALRHDFGPDAESTIAEIDRDLEAQMARDPFLMYAADLFYKAGIGLRRARMIPPDGSNRTESRSTRACLMRGSGTGACSISSSPSCEPTCDRPSACRSALVGTRDHFANPHVSRTESGLPDERRNQRCGFRAQFRVRRNQTRR